MRAIRNEADLEAMACPRKYLRLGTFNKYYSGETKVPIPTVFIGGNHEASNYMWELYHGGWVCPGIYFLGFGGVINFGGLRIGGMSGIYNHHHHQVGHYEVSPYNDNNKRSIYHVRQYDTYKMLQVKEPMDVFLSHDWPRGIEQYGDTQGLLRRKSWFLGEVQSNTLGSPAHEEILKAVKPEYWFAAHLHVRFQAFVEWKDQAKAQQEASQAQPTLQEHPAVQPSVIMNPDAIDIELSDEEDACIQSAPSTTMEAVKNPDEIQIELDDEDEEQESQSRGVNEKAEAQTTAVATVSNPEEIYIEMDDESEGETGGGSASGTAQTAPPQQGPMDAKPKPYPTSTTFLSLDKCLPNKKFLEIMEFPNINGPREFIELAVNREWVRNNITLKRGLAIPDNFQQTAPAHDPVRTMGPQQKTEALRPFLNPQTAEFCSMLQIPNKINPHGRRV
ncbi:lariat debranching enzyme [Gamsiella multidivaricata]|nr:lariat debranching enzyme [Gamsiella multidivaricata]